MLNEVEDSEITYLQKRISYLENEISRAQRALEAASSWANVYVQDPSNIDIASEKLLASVDEYNAESSNSLRKSLGFSKPNISSTRLAKFLVEEWRRYPGEINQFMRLSKEEYELYNSEKILPEDFVARHFGDIFENSLT